MKQQPLKNETERKEKKRKSNKVLGNNHKEKLEESIFLVLVPLLGDGGDALLEGELLDGLVVGLDELLPLVEGSLLLGGDLGALADGGVLGLLGGAELVPGGVDDLGLGAEGLGGGNLGELPSLLGEDVEATEGLGEDDARDGEHFGLFSFVLVF